MYLRIAQDLAAVPAAPSKRAYRQLNQQIKVIVHDYPKRNIINYLRTLLYTIFFHFFYHRVYLFVWKLGYQGHL